MKIIRLKMMILQVAAAAEGCLEEILDGGARNYRKELSDGDLGRVELLQYVWWRRWQITLQGQGEGGGDCKQSSSQRDM